MCVCLLDCYQISLLKPQICCDCYCLSVLWVDRVYMIKHTLGRIKALLNCCFENNPIQKGMQLPLVSSLL